MELTSSVQKQISRFAIAAVVAALALASQSQAQIVYHKVNIVSTEGSYNLDLNNDGVTDFVISIETGGVCEPEQEWVFQFEETPSSGNGAITERLSKGASIGPDQDFSADAFLLAYDYGHFDLFSHPAGCQYTSGGPWLAQSGYLGLSFQLNGQTYYGWALLSEGAITGTLSGYAYESTPGMAILAGQTK
jgi:hypothetical protein